MTTGHIVSLLSGIAEVPTKVATVTAQASSSSADFYISTLDLSVSLSADKQQQVRSLLWKYSSVFSAHEGDLGCTNLISRGIPFVDEILLHQCYRSIPPSGSVGAY